MSDEHSSPLSLEAARSVLALKPDPCLVSRMNELAEKAGVGVLTDEEAREIGEYRHFSRLFDILKLKATLVIQRYQ